MALAIGGLAVGLLYRTALHEKRSTLVNYAATLAAFVDTAATLGLTVSGEATKLAAIQLATDTFSQLHDIGRSSRILLVDRTQNGPTVLVWEEREDPNLARRASGLPLGKDWSATIEPAFAGKTGYTVLHDEHGHELIAAYAPVRSLGMALIAAEHTREVGSPFLPAVIMVIFFGTILAGLGGLLSYEHTAAIVRKAQVNERRFKEFAEIASDWYWEMDENLRFLSVGRGERPGDEFSYSRYVGMTREQVTCEDTTTPKWQSHLADLADRKPFKNFQYDLEIDGERRAMTVSGFPVFGRDGKFTGYRGTGRDITEIIRNRRRLESAEARLRATFEHITVGIVQIDSKGIIEGANPMAVRTFGYSEDELIGRNVSMLMTDADREHHDDYLANYLTTRQATIIGSGREVIGRKKSGTTFPLHLGVAEVNLQGGTHFIGSLTDLTQLRALESQLRRSQKMDAIGHLTGGIAHDFNNLLGIVIGNLDLARRKLQADDSVLKNIEKATNAANRGSDLTRRLLNFSRQTPEESEVVDINASIREIRELVLRTLPANISVDLMLSVDAWPARINKGDFEDSLVNFAVNARDAMPDGGILLIETRNVNVDDWLYGDFQQLPPGDYVEISVSDTGVGMTEDVAARVFEPFFTTKVAGKGTGLGMAMIYGFVQRSKGGISVYSEVGLGSTFNIRLPRADADDIKPSVPIPRLDAETLPRGSESILIVDDEPDLAEFADTLLRDLGYKTIVAHSGPEALQVLDMAARPVHALFTDVVMPGGLNGFELADEARKIRPDLKVLLASGFSAEAAEKSLASCHHYSLLNKPYTVRQLAQEIRRTLDHAPDKA